MKKMAALALMAVSAVLAAPAARAQTVDEIIEKNLQARGGKDKIMAVKTARATGHMTLGQGMDAPFVITWKKPAMVRMEFTVQGMTGVQAYDGTSGWSLMPFMGKPEAEKMSEEDTSHIKEQADWEGPLVDWKAKGHQVELVGKETVEGTEVYKLKVTRKNGEVTYEMLDAGAYLEIKEEGKRNIRGQEMEFETTLGDYKDVSGLMLAHSLESKAKGMPQSQQLTFDKFEINIDVPDDHFRMPAPKPAAAPEPAKP
jgi:outer membrane lipoprotein-sorting protein